MAQLVRRGELEPIEVAYPVLWRNLTQVVGTVLEALGLDPRLAPAPVLERQADQRSDEWVDRYRADAEERDCRHDAVDETLHVDELRLLEAEAVHIIREVVAELERPVLLFSAGKDSIVLLPLAEKAFRPSPLPFPVLHVDTGHNFPEVIEFRDRRVTTTATG